MADQERLGDIIWASGDEDPIAPKLSSVIQEVEARFGREILAESRPAGTFKIEARPPWPKSAGTASGDLIVG